ncbi:MAG: primosomal protein N' [Candidatus Ancaeobacter aquaticus]|nr:primosomal protein N' [Candidatus Ancaeobacter aquaticus]
MRKKYATIVLDSYLDRLFDYRIPEELYPQIKNGMRVRVPFGKRMALGYVCETSSHSDIEGTIEIKEISAVVDKEPIFDEQLLTLLKWIADYYYTSLGAVVRSALPSSVRKIKEKDDRVEYALLKEKISKENLQKLKKRSPKQYEILSILMKEGIPLKLKELLSTCNATVGTLKSIVQKGYVEITKVDVPVDGDFSCESYRGHTAITLTNEQESVLHTIKETIDTALFKPFLLHGVTGSGKTEVYIRAIAHAQKSGKGALVLVPEISLTPQTVERFAERFGDTIAVLHSRLTPAERNREWKRISSGSARIVIGARSSIFAPVKDLGVIIVDEEHDKSFKQENNPRYHARDVAVMRAKVSNAVVVLGSATPSLESYYNTQRGKYQLLELPTRVDNQKLPRVRIIDMKQECDRAHGGVMFSSVMLQKIDACLKNKEQIILFLNRRGHSTCAICDSCGHVVKCDNCSISMTYHEYGKRLLCHLCGTQKEILKTCPSCKKALRHAGYGTQKVEMTIAKIFPKARIARMDADTTKLRGSHQNILDSYKTGDIDILIGTQMIAKGLDFPRVTLVGVINADVSLNFPDFRASEMTFQLLTQVAGRSGRSQKEGEVVIQTFLPRQYAISAAKTHDYRSFYDQELDFRKQLGYPPYSHFISIIIAGTKDLRVKETAFALEKVIQKIAQGKYTIMTPVPAPIHRAKKDYRWQIIIKTAQIRSVTNALTVALKRIKIPYDVKCHVDVDPQVLM